MKLMLLSLGSLVRSSCCIPTCASPLVEAQPGSLFLFSTPALRFPSRETLSKLQFVRSYFFCPNQASSFITIQQSTNHLINSVIILRAIFTSTRQTTLLRSTYTPPFSNMRLLVLAVLAFVGCISTALAAAEPGQEFLNESAPFNLVLLSANTTLNGTRLYACHQVILQTSLCTVSCHKMPPAYPRPEHGTVFYLNYTKVEQEPHSSYRPTTPDLGVEGILTSHYFAYHSDYKPSSMRFVDSTRMSLFNWG